MFLVIDNYDSFVYNLARYVGLAGCDYRVVRNDQITVSEIKDMKPKALVISPGPRTPDEAGISREAVRRLGNSLPILGVCLGHQCIGEAYGGTTIRAKTPMHGKSSPITHDGKALFTDIPQHLEIGRYHSLAINLPEASPLRITAHSDDGEIMAIQHQEYPVYGVQFHPESVLTQHGHAMMGNFVSLVKQFHA